VQRQAREQTCQRARSALTQQVKAGKGRKVSVHAMFERVLERSTAVFRLKLRTGLSYHPVNERIQFFNSQRRPHARKCRMGIFCILDLRYARHLAARRVSPSCSRPHELSPAKAVCMHDGDGIVGDQSAPQK